jgi:hypothetical protein
MRIHTLVVVILSVFLLCACGAAPTFDGSTSPGTTGGGNGNNGVTSSKNAASVKSSGIANSSRSLATSSQLQTSSVSNSSVASSSMPSVLSSAAASSSISRKTTSHNFGKNCLSCHKVGGEAEAVAVFAAAGSIYQSNGAPQTNAFIHLYVPGTNTVAASLETDASGNFYTSDVIAGLPSGAGVDAEVEGAGGKKINMTSTVKNGGCNTCHNGKVTSKIAMD